MKKFFTPWPLLFILIPACDKTSNPPPDPNITKKVALQYKWTLVSRTAIFQDPADNFKKPYQPGDYIEFSRNDTVIANLGGSPDLAAYRVSGDTLYLMDHQPISPMFKHQEGTGVTIDSTAALIVTLKDSLLVLNFPVEISRHNGQVVAWFSGIATDTLKK
jgi:hypothetical protein